MTTLTAKREADEAYLIAFGLNRARNPHAAEEHKTETYLIAPIEGSDVKLEAARIGEGDFAEPAVLETREVTATQPFRAIGYWDEHIHRQLTAFVFRDESEVVGEADLLFGPSEGDPTVSERWELRVNINDLLSGYVQVAEYNAESELLASWPPIDEASVALAGVADTTQGAPGWKETDVHVTSPKVPGGEPMTTLVHRSEPA